MAVPEVIGYADQHQCEPVRDHHRRQRRHRSEEDRATLTPDAAQSARTGTGDAVGHEREALTESDEKREPSARTGTGTTVPNRAPSFFCSTTLCGAWTVLPVPVPLRSTFHSSEIAPAA